MRVPCLGGSIGRSWLKRAMPCGGLVSATLAAQLAASALVPARADAAELSVCVDTSDPSAGIGRKVADAVAQLQGETLVVHEFDGSGDDDDGFALKNFHKLAAQTCQMILGFPVDATSGELPPGLKPTSPYARVGYVLVTTAGNPATTLAAFPDGTDVGVTYLTTPNLYFANHPNVTANVFQTDAETLKALVDGKVKAAMVWRATLVDYLARHADGPGLAFHELSDPHARSNLVGLYDDRNSAAASSFNEAIGKLRGEGKLQPLVAPYSVAAGMESETRFGQASSIVGARVMLATATSSIPASASGSGAPAALYTAEQAQVGATLFASDCSTCHGKDLMGMAGPALTGPHFAAPKDNFHVSDIFTIVTKNMPASQPGSLSKDEYVHIMAFLLKSNGYPAGNTQLTFDQAISSQTPFVYQGK